MNLHAVSPRRSALVREQSRGRYGTALQDAVPGVRVRQIPGGEQWLPSRLFRRFKGLISRCSISTTVALLLVSVGAYGSPPGTVISNQARLDYQNAAAAPATAVSNVVTVVTAVTRSPASVELTRVQLAGSGAYQEPVGPSACLQSGTYTDLADPVIFGGTITPSEAQQVDPAGAYNLGEPIFVRLDDADQNVDAAVVDYALVRVRHSVSGDTETIRLIETAADSGIFSGYVPSSRGSVASGDCVLQGSSNSAVEVSYSDPADPDDSAAANAMLDPVSRVFESQTGLPIDGATVAIVDASSGLPVPVFGNDGVSIFPSVIISGASATDSSGTLYSFAAGEFRFPVVNAGNFRLVVEPPSTYAAPSVTPPDELQLLPGAPFTLGPASYGAEFTQGSALPVNFDIPLDPREDALFLQKTTRTTTAAPGDFVRYELRLDNAASAGVASNVTIVDQLPPGVRFVADSATRDGQSTPSPSNDIELSQLQFQLGDVAAGERVTLSYVVEIISGERNTELVNTARAFADVGLVSNESVARIRLTEDLFRTTGTLIGRVVDGDCRAGNLAEDQGVAGIRIYLEDGRFAVSDEGGRFHFEGLRPGTHVAQIDRQSVPPYFDIVGCESAPQFAGRKDSQFVRLHQGSLLRADFYLRRKLAAEGQVDIQLANHATDSAEELAYLLNVNGKGNIRIRDLNVMILLPDGVSYLPGSLTIDGNPAADPRVVGQSLTIPLTEQFGDWGSELRMKGAIARDTEGELTTRAFAKFNSPIESGQQTPVVETAMLRESAVIENTGYVLNLQFGVLSADLSAADRTELDELITTWRGVDHVGIAAIGHSDSQNISPANRHLYADNYALSRARAESAASYLANALNARSDRINVEGRGPDDPLADNATADGRQANRRVELILSGKRPAKPSVLEVMQKTSGVVIAATQGKLPGSEEADTRSVLESTDNDTSGLPSSQVEAAIESLMPGTELLLPAADFQPAIPSTKISVKHDVAQKAQVFLNGKPVNPLNFDGTETNVRKTLGVSRWKGVDLRDGGNIIRVEVHNADGSVAAVLEREITYAGSAIRAEIVPELSVLVADGKTRPRIAIRLFDRAGALSRKGGIGAFRVSAPYRSWWEVEYERKNEIVAIGQREPIYRIGADGIAYLELEPTTQAGEAEITLNFDNRRQQELRTWLHAQPRDWILVGFAEGTVGYNTLSKNMNAALGAGEDDGYFDEGRVAFFAKGQIRGDYLMTLSYDSDRERTETRESFQSPIDPAAYYTLYGDRSEQRFDAPSQRKLYLKLERRQFFALFGDYDAGLSVTELARYERRFNGLKSGYRGEHVGYTAFATETNQSFLRDEIRGDGTSGLYRLQSAPIITNSDQVRIEVRDRFDTGEVLKSTTLSRFLDYSLDSRNGTLYFKKPIPSRDASFNPVFIVVEYESASAANEEIVAGGRASLRSRDDSVEVGLSYIDENQQGAEAELAGADLRWQLNPETLVNAEMASSSRMESGTEITGDAYLLTLEHQGEKLDLRAYMKEVDEGFGLGQQNAAEKGVRKVGVDGRAQVAERLFFDGEASWQQNLESDAIRQTARAQIRYEKDGLNVSTGLIHASDEFADGETRDSNLAELGISKRMGKVTLRANNSFALGQSADNTDFPTTLLLGADYRLMQGVELFAEYEDASGSALESTMSRLGIRATPWNRAQLNTSLTSQETEFGPRLFSNLGLVQGFQLSERWSLDVGLDQSNTITDANLRQFDPARELSSGSLNDDFIAVFLGASFSADAWSANSRVEMRNSDSEKRMSLLSGWYREPSLGHGLSAGVTVFSSENVSGARTSAADFRFGWAWRTAESDWSFLNRTDVVIEDTVLLNKQDESWRVINNFNANRRLSSRTQLSLQYAFKYVRSMFDSLEISGYTDLTGLDFRRGFKNKWDWGAHASVYHAYRSSVFDYGFGLDLGYNVRENMWLTLGYNIAGFHDNDFAQARYTAQGPYLQISIKADQALLRNIAGRR